jgi:hypothetical protein
MTALDPALSTAHTVGLSGLAGYTLYRVRVRSRDAAGNLGVSGDLTFRTLDGTPPTVSIAAPTAGATVSASFPVKANASDNVGVVSVQFKLDGALLGAEDTTPPYGISWDTTTAVNGSHTLTAIARDAAGNQTTSAAVTVTVSNDAAGDLECRGLGRHRVGRSRNARLTAAALTSCVIAPTTETSFISSPPAGRPAAASGAAR